MALSFGARVEAQSLSADFSASFSGNDYGTDFEKAPIVGCTGLDFACDATIASGALKVTRNAPFRTKRSDIAPTPSAPLTIDADFTWSGNPTLAFLAWRDPDGTNSLGGEPMGGYYLRMHPTVGANGLTHPCLNQGTIVTSYTESNLVPSGFYSSQPIHVHVVDDGTTAAVTLSNGASQTFSFNITGVNNTLYDDGYIVFSGDTYTNGSQTVSWDNITIQQGSVAPAAVAVPTLSEWGMMAMFAMLAAGFVMHRRRSSLDLA